MQMKKKATGVVEFIEFIFCFVLLETNFIFVDIAK